MSSFTLTMFVLLITVFGVHETFGLFIPDKNISLCYGLHCLNNGTVDSETCSCQCMDDYHGLLCNKEIKPSPWPDGTYSLLSTVFGCPEPDEYGWKSGHVNLTVSSHPTIRQRFPERFRLLGPYHLHSIQLNFCARTSDRSHPITNMSWPQGHYCIFNVIGEPCPDGFNESSLPLKDYSVWKDDILGVIPDATVSDDGVELAVCCRDDGENGTGMDLPTSFPFYLLRPSPLKPCQEVTGMVTTEEDFSFVKNTNRTWTGRDGRFTVEESDLYFNLTFCYYEPYERRECMFIEDHGSSYRGRANTTRQGTTCSRWSDLSPEFRARLHKYYIYDLKYEGDYEKNYCRQTWVQQWKPWCVNSNGRGVFCDIPWCDFSDDLPNIIKRKVLRSSPANADFPVQNIADGNPGRPPFVTLPPYVEPWIQVHLQEDYEIHALLIRKAYEWWPYLNRRIVGFVSKHPWDFLTFGAYTCDGPFNYAGGTELFRMQCRRPLIGSFVTLQNYVHYDPHVSEDANKKFEVSELYIQGKATGCGKSLGIKTGAVKDFQLTSSSNGKGHYTYHARLNRKTGWCAQTDDLRPFIQVDLLTPMVVQGIVIQGWTDGRTARIPDNFTMEYGFHNDNLTAYVNSLGQTKIFHVAQTVAISAPQIVLLPNQLLTRIIRLYLYQQSSPVCVKFDLLGCPKKLDFDLKCHEGSTRLGLQALPGHISSLSIEDGITYGTPLELCRSLYLSNLDKAGAYTFMHWSPSCYFLNGNRYNRHTQDWWETGFPEQSQYGQLMCVKDITNADTCGGVVRTKSDIVSPAYPFYYGENINCTWTVKSDEGRFVSLELIDISLAVKEEAEDDFTYFDCEDTLTIYNRGEDIVATVTGHPFETLEGPRYISSSNEIDIILTSCSRIKETSARGFTIRADFVDCGGCGQGQPSCSKKVTCTDQCGYISSPDYPNFYPVSSSCQWRIQGHMGQYVTVNFDMIDLIAEGECEGDYVSLFDLDLHLTERLLLGKFCKIKRPIEVIKSSWHILDVEFYSDFQTVGRGFILKYELKTIRLTSASQNSSGTCNDTWYEYDHSCYSFNDDVDGLSWFDAEMYCIQMGGHLVSISDKNEMAFLQTTIITGNLFNEQESYIGLRKRGTHNFEWTDGTPLTYTDWYKGDGETSRQPDGLDKEACTTIKMSELQSTAIWHDVACAFDKIKQFICEKKSNASQLFEDQTETAESQMISKDPVTAKDGYYFWCNSGEHISSLYVCDGNTDCRDGSEEANCTKDPCPRGMYQCSDGGCVNIAFYCDHKHHCQDGSDENNCVYRECTTEEWKCTNGQCVPAKNRCDLLLNCLDGSDENNCERCRKPFFQCYDGRCLAPARVCDGFVDCAGQYREDEGPQCTTNSQPSCSAWHALGARQNGKFHINMEGSTDAFPVDCVFNSTQDAVTTIIHHSMEDMTVSGVSEFTVNPISYTIPLKVIDYVMSTSSQCHQHLHFDCLQAFDYFDPRFSHWFDKRGRKRYFRSYTNNCSCILIGACNENKTRCGCDRGRQELFVMDDNDWLTDSGYLDDIDKLPITGLWLDKGLNFGRIRFNIGPLICEEPPHTTTVSLLCKSGVVVSSIHRCILDYDIYNHPTGCRDLTHLEDCDDFKCPADHVKCPTSFCIPLRLVCDGYWDCVDGMDERGCSNMSCPGRFRCHGNRVCIPWQQVCDDVWHCPTGDDESFCNISCSDACTCNGSSVICSHFYINDVELLSNDTRELDLSASLNTTLPNHTFHHLKNLAVLDLSYLGANELEQNCFSGLHNLIYLDLSMNYLEEIPEGLFLNMGNLKTLLMNGNNILRIYPGSFHGLIRLPSLDLSNMGLEKLVNEVFRGLKHLLIMNLSLNAVTSVEDGAFYGLEKLQLLDLRKNYITDFTGELFSGLEELIHLYNDKYVFCCFRPPSVQQSHCEPRSDEFSSCSDLMRNEALRISMWILGIIALAGNVFALIYRCIYDKESLRRSNDLFVANLALSDFFMGVYMIMIASADEYYRGVYSLNDEIWRGSWVCHLAGFLASLSSETSVMFLCMITLERMIVIRFPFKNFNHVIQKFSRYICLTVWCIGILFAGIPLLPIFYFSGSFYSRSGVCLALPLTRNRPPGWEYSTAVFVFWNFICFVFIAIGQAVIYHTVKASQKIRRGRTNKDMIIARKLSFIVITDFVCWFPICVMGVLALQGHVIRSEVYAWVAVFVLPINSALNPIIYTWSSANIVRRRKTKRENTFHSSTSGGAGRPKVTVCQLLKDDIICVTKPKSAICLTSYMSSLTSARDMVTIVHKLTESLDKMHSGYLISGDIDSNKIYVVVDNGVVRKVLSLSDPVTSDADEDFSKDILDLGNLVAKMLRVYMLSKREKKIFTTDM